MNRIQIIVYLSVVTVTLIFGIWLGAYLYSNMPYLNLAPIAQECSGISGSVVYSDYAVSNYMSGFQDPANNTMYAIINLHDQIVFYLIIILLTLLWGGASVIYHSGRNLDHFKFLSHGSFMETVWTISPAIILWLIGIPSLKLLYIMDNLYDSQLTIQIVGNQWYWNYNYSDYDQIDEFDSYLVDESDLE